MAFEVNRADVAPSASYQEIYSVRTQRALRSSPVTPLLYSEITGFRPDYASALQNVDMVTRSSGICDHGWNHITNVSRNAMMLADVARFRSQSSNAIEDLSGSEILSDGMLLFAAMHSDLAYGDTELVIEGRSVFEHAERSSLLIDQYQGMQLPLQQDEPISRVQIHAAALKSAISIDMDEATKYAAQLYMQPETITASQIFVVIHKLADVLDYYRAARVSHISASDQVNNPYFHLSNKVSEYSLNFDGSLIYRARMDYQQVGIAQDGSPIVSFDDWLNASRITVDDDRKNYDEVWQLADLYCAILGISFKVEEMI